MSTSVLEDVSVPGATESATSVSRKKTTKVQTAVVPDPPRDEQENLEPVPTGPIVLENGQEIVVVPLRLRESMNLLKIVTRGAGGMLGSMMDGLDLEDGAAFAQTPLALVFFAIPEAIDESVHFFRIMVEPANYEELSAKERVEQTEQLNRYMDNPSLIDVFEVTERVIRRESEDLRNLGKRIGTALQVMTKTGQVTE